MHEILGRKHVLTNTLFKCIISKIFLNILFKLSLIYKTNLSLVFKTIVEIMKLPLHKPLVSDYPISLLNSTLLNTSLHKFLGCLHEELGFG